MTFPSAFQRMIVKNWTVRIRPKQLQTLYQSPLLTNPKFFNLPFKITMRRYPHLYPKVLG